MDQVFGVVLDPAIVEIELDNLHVEFQMQAPYMCRYGEALADAEKERAKMFARKAGDIRAADPKVSQNKLESQINEDPEYIDILHSVARLKSFVESLKAKLRSLGYEADLWINEYYSTPREPRSKGVSEINSQRTRELSTKQREAINRNTREKGEGANE